MDDSRSLYDRRYRLRRENRRFAGWEPADSYAHAWATDDQFLAMGFAPASGDLLELGCGAGNFACRFAQKGYTVTGVDISPVAIDWAKENASAAKVAVRFVVGDAVGLPDIASASMDFVFDGHLMHCIIGEDRQLLLENVRRVLRPNGFFMVRHVVLPVESTDELVVDADTHIAYLNGETPYRYYPEAEELVGELETAGFDVLQWDYSLTLDDGYGFQHATVQCAAQ